MLRRKYYVGKKNELIRAMRYWKNVIENRIIKLDDSNYLKECYEAKLNRANELLNLINCSHVEVYGNYEDSNDMKRALKRFYEIDF